MLETQADATLKDVMPIVKRASDAFNKESEETLNENKKLHDELADLIKDKNEVLQQIGEYKARIARMESKIGIAEG